eukprot:3505943-Rhodomonas_salina.2
MRGSLRWTAGRGVLWRAPAWTERERPQTDRQTDRQTDKTVRQIDRRRYAQGRENTSRDREQRI